MTSDQLGTLVQVSKWETEKMRNLWTQKFTVSERIRRIQRAERNKDSIESNWWKERGRTTPMVAFDYGFLTQVSADTFPILLCRDSRYGQTGATCCERKGPTAYSISFHVGFIKDPGYRRIILKCDNEASTKALQDAVIHACVEWK